MLLRDVPRTTRELVRAARISEETATRHPAAWDSFWRRQCEDQWLKAVIALLACLALPHDVHAVPEAIALAHVPPQARRAPGTTHETMPPCAPLRALRGTSDRVWTFDAARGLLSVTYRTPIGRGRIAWSLGDPGR